MHPVYRDNFNDKNGDTVSENLAEALRNLSDAVELGADGLDKLDRQSETLDNICKNTNRLNENLNDAEHKIKEMENPWRNIGKKKDDANFELDSDDNYYIEGTFMKYTSVYRNWYSSKYKFTKDLLTYSKLFGKKRMSVNILTVNAQLREKGDKFTNGHKCKHSNVVEFIETTESGKKVLHIFRFKCRVHYNDFASFITYFSDMNGEFINVIKKYNSNDLNRDYNDLNNNPMTIEICAKLDELDLIAKRMNHKVTKQISNIETLNDNMSKTDDRLIKDSFRIKKL